jgi:hypothetical protein
VLFEIIEKCRCLYHRHHAAHEAKVLHWRTKSNVIF